MPVIDRQEGRNLEPLVIRLTAPDADPVATARSLFVERLDFEPDTGELTISPSGSLPLPAKATRIACLPGLHVVLVTFPSEDVSGAAAKATSKALDRQIGDHLLLARTQGGVLCHIIHPRNIGTRVLLKRLVLERNRPSRTTIERLTTLYTARIKDGLDARTACERAFDVEAVTIAFYECYADLFRVIEAELLAQSADATWSHDYSLQLLNRTMFLYFLDRKGWLGSDFLARLRRAYERAGRPVDTFFDDWIKVLFFEAFNRRFSHPSYMPPDIRATLQMAPYLNGGLYTQNQLDNLHQATIRDAIWTRITNFFDSYNFTISESTPWDQEVAVDPEMIGRVYENLVNVSDLGSGVEGGIHYTPRTEIDLMCRLALVDNLSNHLGEQHKKLLYELVFAIEFDEKDAADTKVREADLWVELDQYLRQVTVLDPACGSGSFLVGMLQVLDDLAARSNRQLGTQELAHERKKRIIAQSLYGVDVMPWAVDVAELRLWLQLVIDTDISEPERILRPLLPNLSFKIRCGDSLVQQVGATNLSHFHGLSTLPASTRGRLIQLKGAKLHFYYNVPGRLHEDEIQQQEFALFRTIVDQQIEDLEKQVREARGRLESARVEQGQLAGISKIPDRQSSMDERRFEEELGRIETDRARIRTTRQALVSAKDIPFVWDIAFVEVFEGEHHGFDIVVGNPPYVRQERISNPDARHQEVSTEEKREYKARLARAIYCAWPRFFGYKPSQDSVSHGLDAKSDLYVYFYFLSLALLNNKGTLSFITSNSWLDVDYGKDLQEFLLRHSHVKMILDNATKRSFAQADVNTVVSLLSSPDDCTESGIDKIARFVMFFQPFECVAFPKVFTAIEDAGSRDSSELRRVEPRRQRELLGEGLEKNPDTGFDNSDCSHRAGPDVYVGNKWGGKYLRAPDIYHTVLSLAEGKMDRLDGIAQIRRGFTTGANDFFYLVPTGCSAPRGMVHVRNGVGWEGLLEEEYLKPVLKSPREVNSILISPESLSTRLFLCNKPKSSLRGTRALEYIEWGERQKTKGRQKQAAGTPWVSLPSFAARDLWYAITLKSAAHVFCNRFFSDRYFFCYCPGAVEDQTFYGAAFVATRRPTCQIALLNSTFQHLLLALLGRVALGEGVLQYAVYEMNRLPVLNANHFDDSTASKIEEVFSSLRDRRMLPVELEVHQSDRKLLDGIVAHAIGVPHAVLEDVYDAVVRLTVDRANKALSVRRVMS